MDQYNKAFAEVQPGLVRFVIFCRFVIFPGISCPFIIPYNDLGKLAGKYNKRPRNRLARLMLSCKTNATDKRKGQEMGNNWVTTERKIALSDWSNGAGRTIRTYYFPQHETYAFQIAETLPNGIILTKWYNTQSEIAESMERYGFTII